MERNMEYCVIVSKQISLPSCLMLRIGDTASCVDCIWEYAKRADIAPSQEAKKHTKLPHIVIARDYAYAKKAFEASASLHRAARRLLLTEVDKVMRNRHLKVAVRKEAKEYYWRMKDGN